MSSFYRIVVVGAGGVGKSCLTIQFIANRFVEDYDPTLEDSYRRQFACKNQECVLEILDTAGQDDYVLIREAYYHQGDGFLCVFDVTNPNTFKDVSSYHSAILRAKDLLSVPFVLAGNKTDMDHKRKVTKADAQKLAQELNCKYIETSAKLRYNVDEIFTELVSEVIESRGPSTPKPSSKQENDKSSDTKSKKKTCVMF